ncbi:MAG: hypothetical protein ACI9OJ_005833, partial [Myxococcota bacterium]
RREILGRIGAASQSGSLGASEYRDLFADLFDSLEGSYYEEQRPTIRRIAIEMLTILGGDADQVRDPNRAIQALEFLYEQHGYTEGSAREMVAAILADRLSE